MQCVFTKQITFRLWLMLLTSTCKLIFGFANIIDVENLETLIWFDDDKEPFHVSTKRITSTYFIANMSNSNAYYFIYVFYSI